MVTLLFSKAFGISLFATLLAGGLAYRRLPHALRLVWLASLLLWVWTSFGSQVPWSYKPFWRMSRFLHPLVLALTVLFGATMGGRFALRARAPAVAVLGICLFNLLAGGSWGQSARISRELLDYARAHPEKRFLTDYRTINEMHVLNRVQTLSNVATTGEAARYRLLDPNAEFAWPVDLPSYDEMLINPLNLKKTPAFAKLVESLGGDLRFETTPAYRPICQLVRPLRRFDWAMRKPPARVVAFSSPVKPDTVAASHSPGAETARP